MNARVAPFLIAVLFATGAAASAQTVPALPAIPPGVSSIVQSLAGDAAAPYGLDPNHVRGVVTYCKGFDLQVRMPLNRYKTIHLHRGTEIDPRGTTLTDGQVVDVKGRAAGDGSLDADVVTLVRG